MMLRTLVCMLAATLALLPASAQNLQRGQSSAHMVQLSAASLFNQISAPAQSEAVGLGEYVPTEAAQNGNLASAVFRVLAVRNTIQLGMSSPAGSADMDDFLRHPDEDAPAAAVVLFNRAKQLYDSATTFKSYSYDLTVDPLSLRAHLRINLSRAFSGGSN